MSLTSDSALVKVSVGCSFSGKVGSGCDCREASNRGEWKCPPCPPAWELRIAMYHRPTTFLLGAGASWHYGYPTGEELVNRVIFETANLEKFLNEGLRFHQLIFPQVFDEMSKIKKIQQNSSSLINEAFKNVEILKNSLKTGVPFSIDYFIGRNPSIAPIAKMLVAHVIMDCEKNWQATNQNRNRNDGSAGQDDWVRILVENLKRGCSSGLIPTLGALVSPPR